MKTFSMASRVHRPGFHLLSLAASSHSAEPTQTFAHSPCLLPDQLGIYTARYAPLGVLTLAILLLLNVNRAWRRPYLQNGDAHGYGRPGHANARRESAVWSPASPTSDRSGPPSPLPNTRTLRTPSRGAFTPSLRASRPSTPLDYDSPLLLSPNLAPDREGHDDDEDYMDPVQYARKPHVEDAEGSYFLPTPGARKLGGKKPWSWSWTFVASGRRRRITLRAPSLSAVSDLYEIVRVREGRSGYGRKRGFMRLFLVDVLAVAWPPAVAFAVIAWWMFR